MTKSKLLLAAAIAAPGVFAAVSASAQAAPQILVVDVDRVASTCNACRTAATQFQGQVQQAQQRADALRSQLQTAGQPLQTSVTALNGKAPDAALQARITSFQQQEASANQELQQTQQRLQSVQQNINRQIGEKLVPISDGIVRQRGAAVAVARNSTLANSAAADISADVLAQLNAQLTTISVTPLPQQAGGATVPAAAPAPAPATSGRRNSGGR